MFCCPVAKLCPDSSWPHGLRHSRLPCPSPSPGVCHIHVRCTSDAVQLTHLLVPSSPLSSIFPSIRVLSNESAVHIRSDQIRSDQSLSRVQLFATPWIAAHQASLSITNSWSPLRLMSIESGGHNKYSVNVSNDDDDFEIYICIGS